MLLDILKLSVIVTIVDAVYLKSFSNWFNNVVSSIQGTGIEMNYIAAILCYILIIFTIKFFVIDKKFNYLETYMLGFSIYGIFELTNKAIFKEWDWISVVIDTVWGGLLYLISSYLYKSINI